MSGAVNIARRNFLRGRPIAAVDPTSPPRHFFVRIGDECLTTDNIVCQSCGDACDERAIRFPPLRNAVARPSVEHDACVGCGDCVEVCPRGAVSLQDREMTRD